MSSCAAELLVRSWAPRAQPSSSCAAELLRRSQALQTCSEAAEKRLQVRRWSPGQTLGPWSLWPAGGSIRSLNPSFSRGSLAMSWLQNKNNIRGLHVLVNSFVDSAYLSIRHSRYSLDWSRHLELSKLFSLRHFMKFSLKERHSPGRKTAEVSQSELLRTSLSFLSFRSLDLQAEGNRTFYCVGTFT